jgi:hypothetical protein
MQKAGTVVGNRVWSRRPLRAPGHEQIVAGLEEAYQATDALAARLGRRRGATPVYGASRCGAYPITTVAVSGDARRISSTPSAFAW